MRPVDNIEYILDYLNITLDIDFKVYDSSYSVFWVVV